MMPACRHSVHVLVRLIVLAAIGLGLSDFVPAAEDAPDAAQSARSILIVVGPSNHPPGSHEVQAGGRLLQHCLRNSNLSNLRVSVHYEWPQAEAVRAAADTVVFLGDTFPAERFENSAQVMRELGGMMKRGCGIVCIHYATGLRAEDVGPRGEHPLLEWMGGYFATRCKHHQSIARIFPRATISVASPDHPVSRGWSEFTLHDEPYINNYFGPDHNQLAANVTALATSQLPPDSPEKEVVAWGVQRKDGGRGFGIVMPHFYKNWQLDPLRTCILNAVVWTAQGEVPVNGVQSKAPDLAQFKPEAVLPAQR